MKTSVTMKFEKAELQSRQDTQKFQYENRYDGHDAFEGRYCTGALAQFTEVSLQAGLERFHELLTQGYTTTDLYAQGTGTGITFTLRKPSNVVELELKEELKIVESQYKAEIEAYNEALIESEVQKHLATAERKRLEEAVQATATYRQELALEVRAALGVK